MVGELKVAFNKQLVDTTSRGIVMVFFVEEFEDTETKVTTVQMQKFIIDMTGNLDEQFDRLSETWDFVDFATGNRSIPVLKRKA